MRHHLCAMHAWLRQFATDGFTALRELLLLGLLLTPASLYAQTGHISGVAKDPHDALIPDATVTLTNLDTHGQSKTTTDNQGGYEFSAVPSGRYSIEVQAHGFNTASSGEFQIADGDSLTRNFALTVGPSAQTLNVQGTLEGTQDYVVTRNISGAKAELPITEVPQDLVIVPYKILEEQNLTTLDQALKNVAGYSPNGAATWLPIGNYASIRGFNVSNTLKDGLYDDTNTANIAYLGNIEQVEILKGASGLLYGPPWGGLGGVIDLTTKKALPDSFYEVGQKVDSFGSIHPFTDLDQSISQNWSVRAIADGGLEKTFVNYYNPTDWNTSLIVSGRITDKLTVNLLGERLEELHGVYQGQPVYTSTGAPFPIVLPLDYNTYDPRSINNLRSWRGLAAATWRFSDKWSLRVTGEGNRSTFHGQAIYATYNDNGSGSMHFYDNDLWRSVWTYDATLNGRFNTGPLEHTLTVGESNMPVHSYSLNYSATPPNSTFTSPFELPTNAWMTRPSNILPQIYNTNRTVAYVNDIAKLTKRIRLSAGLSFVDGQQIFPANHWHVDDKGVSWRVGPIVQVTEHGFAFADYTTAYVPQNPGGSFGVGTLTYYAPLTGDQTEVGYKYVVGERASITGAIYQIRETNVTTISQNPVLAAEGLRDVSGEQRSRGAELDATYRIVGGWNVLLAYANTNAEVIKDNERSTDYVIGAPLANIARETARLWTTYGVRRGVLRGFSFGGGFYAVSHFRANTQTYLTADGVITPGYFAVVGGRGTVDAHVSWERDGYKVSATATNIFNHRYWETGAIGDGGSYPGQPAACTIIVQKTFLGRGARQ